VCMCVSWTQGYTFPILTKASTVIHKISI